jgi:hypothetical protein
MEKYWSCQKFIEEQPRTQALSTTRLAGGKTLVQTGHVSPRFGEITKILHKGGGLSLFYRSSCQYQFDKIQSVCILTNACNFNEKQELVLQNQWVRCLCICILCGLHLRRRYAKSTYWSLSVSYWENRKELLGKDLSNTQVYTRRILREFKFYTNWFPQHENK